MQLTTLTLNLLLHPGNLSAFRASIVEQVGQEHHIFHNHDNSRGQDHHHWGYPCIQYAVRRGRATIIGIGEGSEAIKRILIPRLPDELSMAGHTYPIGDYRMKSQIIETAWEEHPQRYGLAGWLALNKENYHLWKSTEDADIRRTVLNQALTGHLRVLASGLELPNPKQALGDVLRIDKRKRIQWHGTQLISFDALIQCNLNLIPGIGMGRITAFGFGEVMSEGYYRAYRNSRRSVIAYQS